MIKMIGMVEIRGEMAVMMVLKNPVGGPWTQQRPPIQLLLLSSAIPGRIILGHRICFLLWPGTGFNKPTKLPSHDISIPKYDFLPTTYFSITTISYCYWRNKGSLNLAPGFHLWKREYRLHNYELPQQKPRGGPKRLLALLCKFLPLHTPGWLLINALH